MALLWDRDRMWRRLAVAVPTLALLVSLLSACDPAGPFEVDGGVELTISVNAEGGASAELIFDHHARSKSDVMATGRQLGPLLFPTATGRTSHIGNASGAYPTTVIEASGLYRQGSRPVVVLDLRPAVAWLLDHGYRSARIWVDTPLVASTGSWLPSATPEFRGWSWDSVTSSDQAPRGSFAMSPQPWRGVVLIALQMVNLLLMYSGISLMVIALVRAGSGRRWLALTERRSALRWSAITVLAGSTVGQLMVFAFIDSLRVDNLAVAGYLSDAWLLVAELAPLLSLLLVPVALVALTLLLARVRGSAGITPLT